MAKKVRIDFHSEGFQAVLNSDGVRSRITSMAEAVADQAGEGFEATVIDGSYGGSPRPIGIVHTTTYEAKKAEAEDKVLTSALGAARSA
jgi:hypothetical protein